MESVKESYEIRQLQPIEHRRKPVMFGYPSNIQIQVKLAPRVLTLIEAPKDCVLCSILCVCFCGIYMSIKRALRNGKLLTRLLLNCFSEGGSLLLESFQLLTTVFTSKAI